MKIYTKTGDNGLTSLYDCSRVSKASNLIDLLGDIDELNSFIGIINSEYLIKDIQTWLFDLGTIIANPNKAITRRCERKLVEVKNNYQHIDDNCLIFINRLSDYLFTLARYDSYIKGLTENIYKKSTILQLCNEENK